MLLYKSGYNYLKRNSGEAAVSLCEEEGFSFSNNTTYGLGGEAKRAYFPSDIRQACAVYAALTDRSEKFIVLGNGSNVLAADSRFDGSVIVTKRLKSIVRISESVIFCLAGTTVGELLNYCKRRSLGGLEYLYGIPATIGGLVYMNGGAGGVYINSNVLSVKLYDGKIRNLSNKNCRFGNKYSTMRDINSLILGVFLSILPTSSQKIRENIDFYKMRRSHLPRGRSCGCVFKNPEGNSAGRLIDGAGLKGVSIGGARVSEKHANFIINDGASADDVYKLIALVKDKVRERFGVTLSEEVVYIGEFNDFNG